MIINIIFFCFRVLGIGIIGICNYIWIIYNLWEIFIFIDCFYVFFFLYLELLYVGYNKNVYKRNNKYGVK